MSNIYKAISAIMLEMDAIKKDQKNSAQNFMFRGIDQVYNALQKLLANHEVFSVPILVKSLKFESVSSSKGNAGFHVVNEYTFRFFYSDASFFDVMTIGEAIDYGDKATNKAAAIAHKYALLQVFCIPTEDDKDPDGQSHDLKPKTNPQQQMPREPQSKSSQQQTSSIIAKCQIAYDDKDAQNEIRALGFRWAPDLKCWARQSTLEELKDFRKMGLPLMEDK